MVILLKSHMSLHVACSYDSICTRNAIILKGEKQSLGCRCLCLWILVSTEPAVANELALDIRGIREYDISTHPTCMATGLSVVNRQKLLKIKTGTNFRSVLPRSEELLVR